MNMTMLLVIGGGFLLLILIIGLVVTTRAERKLVEDRLKYLDETSQAIAAMPKKRLRR